MNSWEVWPQLQLWSVAAMVRSDMSGLLNRWSILSRTDLAVSWGGEEKVLVFSTIIIQ